MRIRSTLLPTILLIILPIVVYAQGNDWRTRAERSDFRETSRYAETIDYCKQLAQASPWVRFTSFGTSPDG
ncbi:MAG: peptidase M14, partial [Acidobacteriota bacterium]